MSFVKSPEHGAAAEHLEMQLVQFAAGVAVYEMPVRFVENSVLVGVRGDRDERRRDDGRP